jgi:hypothetical protein
LKAVLVELRTKTYDVYIRLFGDVVRLRLSWRLNAVSSVLCCGKAQEKARRSFISTQVRIPCEMEKITRIKIHVGLSTRFCCCFDLVPNRVLSTESVRHSLYAPRDLDLFFSSVAPTHETFSTTQTALKITSYNTNSLKQHFSPASTNTKDNNDSTHPGPSPGIAAH